jgi:hypothetical protein
MLAVGALLTALMTITEVVVGVGCIAHGRSASRRRTTPHLLARGHSQPVAAMLGVGVPIHGTLYPALPGTNVLQLTVGGTLGTAGAGTLQIRALMPSMPMTPVRAVLQGRDGRYQGSITLPMFGDYVAEVVLATARNRWQRTLALSLPLTLSQ